MFVIVALAVSQAMTFSVLVQNQLNPPKKYESATFSNDDSGFWTSTFCRESYQKGLKPAARRELARQMRQAYRLSEKRACGLIGITWAANRRPEALRSPRPEYPPQRIRSRRATHPHRLRHLQLMSRRPLKSGSCSPPHFDQRWPIF